MIELTRHIKVLLQAPDMDQWNRMDMDHMEDSTTHIADNMCSHITTTF